MEERVITKDVCMNDTRHLIFSDESGWDSDNRFGSLAKVSGSFDNTKQLNDVLKKILSTYNKSELKFKDIKSNNSQRIANEFIDNAFQYLKSSRIKIHVLVWDKQDDRHNIQNWCDIENLKRMYYHNLKVLKEHWKIDTNWEFYPDEFTAIDWENDVTKYLNNRELISKENLQYNLFNEFKNVRIKYKKVAELESKRFPIIQLADLFAGLIRTSRAESETFYKWFSDKKLNGQPILFPTELDYIVSKSLQQKFEVMYEFKTKADTFKLGISLNEKKYFKTFNHRNNIFIWHYEPQSDFDKAPTKIK